VKKGLCSPWLSMYVCTPFPELFTKPSSCWERVSQLLSFRIPAAVRNAFATQSNVFIQTVANSETASQFQLTTLNSIQRLPEYVLTTHTPGPQQAELVVACLGTHVRTHICWEEF